MASGPHWGRVPFETGPRRALKSTDGKRRLIRGEGLVARISTDYEPQLPVVGEDIPGPAVTNCLGTVWSLETVDQRATMVGHGFRLPCFDSEESDDDVLSVGPARPLVTAALLGGTGNSWTADDLYGTCCAQLDDFNWVIPAGDMVGGLPEPDLEVDSSDIKPNVYDVYNDVPDEFPVEMEVTTVESCALLWSFRRDRRGTVTQSCPCVCAKDTIS